MAARNRAERLTALAGLFEAAFRALAARPYSPRGLDVAIGRVAEALVDDVKASGDLALTVAPQGLKTSAGEPLGIAPVAAAIAAPLLRDSLKDVTFRSGLPMDEALPLVGLWVRCAQGPRGTEGLASRAWEMERPHVTLTHNLPAQALGDRAIMEAEQLAKDFAAATTPPIELVHLADDRMGPTLEALKAIDLVPETGTTDAASWMKQVEALGVSLGRPRANALQHFITALVRSADVASPQELEALSAVAERLVRTLASEHRFIEAIDAFRHGSTLAKTDLGKALLVRFRGAMTSPWFMERLIETLNAPEGYDDALNGLRRMGPHAVRSLLNVPALTAEGKRRLGSLIAELDIEGSRQEKASANSQVINMLNHMEGLTADQARETLKRALGSTDVSMRKQALEKMTQAQAMVLVEPLHERVKDPSVDVRTLALKHLAAIEDPTAIPVLMAQLHRTGLAKDERIRLYDTLASIGGPKAGAALTEELRKQADVALKIEAAKHLGRIDHPRVREVLKEEAERLMGPADLRKACKEALAKLGGGK